MGTPAFGQDAKLSLRSFDAVPAKVGLEMGALAVDLAASGNVAAVLLYSSLTRHTCKSASWHP